MLLPTRIDVMYCPGCRSKTFATKSSRPLCFAVDLQFEAVLAHEGDLHARKEGREEQHHEDQDNGYGHRYASVCGSSVCGERAAGAGIAVIGSLLSGQGFHRGRQPPIRRQAFRSLRRPVHVRLRQPRSGGRLSARFRRRLASGNGLFLPDRAGRAAFARSGRRRCGTGRRAGRGLRRLFAGRPVFPVGSFRFGRFVVLLAHIDIHFPREAAETPLLKASSDSKPSP